MVDIDSETLFNGAAAVVATIAVVFFILNVDLGYSPVSKVGLVVVFLAGVFTITQRTSDPQLTLLGYGVIVTSTVVLFADLVSTFEAGNTVTVAGLLVIAAVLFGLGTRLDDQNRFVSGKTATFVFGVTVAVVAVVVVLDVVTGGLAYELQPKSQVEVPEQRRDELRVAEVQARNPTPFPERVSAPNYAVCAAGNWSEYRPPDREGEPRRRVEIRANVQDGYNQHVMGYSSKTYPVTMFVDAANVTGETFRVKQTSSCPATETGTPYIAIYQAPEDRPYGTPV